MENTNQFKLGLFKSEIKPTDFLCTTLVADVIKKLPRKVDWTSQMSPVKNQGAEGACASFAGVAVKEFQEKIDYGVFIDLSERYLYELAKKISGHKNGTTLIAIAKILVEKGVCEEKYYPYIAGKPGAPLPGADENAKIFKIESAYTRISNLQELQACLVKAPVEIGVKIYRNWKRQKNGIIPNPTFRERWRPMGGHAITAVSYDLDTQLITFKNSWGQWGNKGYGTMTFKELKRTFMDGVYMVDICDDREWEEVKRTIKTVKDLTRKERKNSWLK